MLITGNLHYISYPSPFVVILDLQSEPAKEPRRDFQARNGDIEELIADGIMKFPKRFTTTFIWVFALFIAAHDESSRLTPLGSDQSQHNLQAPCRNLI